MDRQRQTPSQTVGPFFAYGLTAEQYGYEYNSIVSGSLASDASEGEQINIVGTVYDGAGNPVADAMIEIWQADAKGVYRKIISPGENGFTGFGRFGTGTDPACHFRFKTIKPGSIGENQAPHIDVILFMRGSLLHLYTRLYFSDEVAANLTDELLNKMPETRRHTLIAEKIVEKGDTNYHFDINMQGENETIFFEL